MNFTNLFSINLLAKTIIIEGVRQSREGVGKEEELEYAFSREGVHAALRVTHRYASAVNV